MQIKIVYKIFPVFIFKISQNFMNKIPGLPKDINAWTGLGLISFMVNDSEDTIQHELVHSRQFIRWTPLLFWPMYLFLQSYRFKWEIQAYAVQLKYTTFTMGYNYDTNLALFIRYLMYDYRLNYTEKQISDALITEYDRIR